jgi:hypothetical protein
METQTRPKPNYPELVKNRAKETHEQLLEAENDDRAIAIIYEALKTTALESWKNGLSAGSRPKSRTAAA